MKKAALIFLNFSMIVLSFIVYLMADDIDDVTYTEMYNEQWMEFVKFGLFVLFFLTNIILSFLYRKYSKISIGLNFLGLSIISFGSYFLNKTYPLSSEYKSYSLSNAFWYENLDNEQLYLHISTDIGVVRLLAPMKFSVKVDSISVRIDEGLFGMKVITNNFKVIESTNCDHSEIDTTNLINSHYKIGNELAKNRCFTASKYHYRKSIELDSLNPDPLYSRGLTYMLLDEYKFAFNDFRRAAINQAKIIDSLGMKTINPDSLYQALEQNLSHINSTNIDGMITDMKKYNALTDLRKILKRLDYCNNIVN